MSEDRKPTRLPPPAFPPGSRRHPAAGAGAGATGAPIVDGARPAPGSLDEAFVLPDDPDSGDGQGFTFISPDEPMPERGTTVEEGTVTGIGDDAHLEPEVIAAGGDPHVRELVHAVSKLTAALEKRGEVGLRVTPDMDRFEATLRAYCVGYLVGRRAEDGSESDEAF
ncbi:MAG: hypothetical protein WD995_10925 [Gemmatimonadota bacterium]